MKTLRPGFVPFMSLFVGGFLAVTSLGCVTRTAFDQLNAEHVSLERDSAALSMQVERLTIERDSLEEQFIEAQESYEDERVIRSALASNLSQLKQKADTLDADLGVERNAHIQAATALAGREAEIAAMQSTYDLLVSDLESEVSSGQIEIERLREGLRLNVSDDVLFASGSAELDQIGREVLEKVAGQLVRLNDFIEVRGHTDNRAIRGSLAKRFPTNWELAAARAARVVRLLEERGVPGDRLAVVSLGPNDPIAPNDSAENRASNRRIEIRLEPREGAAPQTEPAPPAARAAPAALVEPAALPSEEAAAVLDAEPSEPAESAQIDEQEAATAELTSHGSETAATVFDEEPTAPLGSASGS